MKWIQNSLLSAIISSRERVFASDMIAHRIYSKEGKELEGSVDGGYARKAMEAMLLGMVTFEKSASVVRKQQSRRHCLSLAERRLLPGSSFPPCIPQHRRVIWYEDNALLISIPSSLHIAWSPPQFAIPYSFPFHPLCHSLFIYSFCNCLTRNSLQWRACWKPN